MYVYMRVCEHTCAMASVKIGGQTTCGSYQVALGSQVRSLGRVASAFTPPSHLAGHITALLYTRDILVSLFTPPLPLTSNCCLPHPLMGTEQFKYLCLLLSKSIYGKLPLVKSERGHLLMMYGYANNDLQTTGETSRDDTGRSHSQVSKWQNKSKNSDSRENRQLYL